MRENILMLKCSTIQFFYIILKAMTFFINIVLVQNKWFIDCFIVNLW